jgi:clan AA aspartic protease
VGTFYVTIDIGDPHGDCFQPLEVLVDTDSSYTWVPRSLLEQLGVVARESWEFETADGRFIEREVAQMWVRYNGNAHITFVVFGDEGSTPLLGAYTLEGFRLAADPINRRLVPVRGLAMATCG